MIGKVLKSRIFAFVLGLVVAGSIGAYAVSVASNEVTYDNTTSGSSATTVKEAIDDLYDMAENNEYIGGDLIVANWLNEKYVQTTTWSVFTPTLYNDSFFTESNGNLIFKKAGNYRIYYQSAYDGGTTGQGHIRVLINGNSVATCGNMYARCDNRLIYYDASINVNDTLTIQGYTTNAAMGTRAVVSVVLLKD